LGAKASRIERALSGRSYHESQLPPPEKFTADYYILAVPVEVAAPLLIGDVLNGRTIPAVYN
jgi:hypothetical protein